MTTSSYICNATLLDATEDFPPQKRRKGKPYEFLKSFSTFDEAFESFGVLPRLRFFFRSDSS